MPTQTRELVYHLHHSQAVWPFKSLCVCFCKLLNHGPGDAVNIHPFSWWPRSQKQEPDLAGRVPEGRGEVGWGEGEQH